MTEQSMQYGHPDEMEKKHAESARQLSYQQRFKKLVAIIELSIQLQKATNQMVDLSDFKELGKINNDKID
ncbi:MAG: hypothetical protein CFE24_10930 [Flavobacterium sp. BFFFF2]|nr:MAG: hypothetical protein CFE24_10930 [Flavobacterium sp. BFFFF2]